MLYTYILDDSIKSPTLILTADHLTLLFLPGFFYQRENFLFLLWVNLYMIMGLYLHDPPLLTAHFSWPLLFLSLQKLWPSLCFYPPFPPANFWQVPKIENGELCQNIDIQILLISHFLLCFYSVKWSLNCSLFFGLYNSLSLTSCRVKCACFCHVCTQLWANMLINKILNLNLWTNFIF